MMKIIRDWESILSSVFFGSGAIVMVYAVLQVVLFPFGFQTRLSSNGFNEIQFSALQLETLPYYQKMFQTHALFSKPHATSLAQKSDLSELLKSYVLTGMIQGAEPEALIQNHATKQTHFVQTGEQFGQFRVVEIKNHSIIVEYEGRRTELHIEEVKS
jgi:type II secretory pathway component PulC